jgi:hypothetical protein
VDPIPGRSYQVLSVNGIWWYLDPGPGPTNLVASFGECTLSASLPSSLMISTVNQGPGEVSVDLGAASPIHGYTTTVDPRAIMVLAGPNSGNLGLRSAGVGSWADTGLVRRDAILDTAANQDVRPGFSSSTAGTRAEAGPSVPIPGAPSSERDTQGRGTLPEWPQEFEHLAGFVCWI